MIVDTLVVRMKIKIPMWQAIKLALLGIHLKKHKISTEEQMYNAGIWERKYA